MQRLGYEGFRAIQPFPRSANEQQAELRRVHKGFPAPLGGTQKRATLRMLSNTNHKYILYT
jgi:hypothetical protein